MARKAKSAAEPAAGGAAAAAGPAGMERHDLVMQVSLLRAQLDQAQKHNVALLKTTQTLQAKIKQQETDQADVFFQLHKDLDASSDKVTALEAERDGLRSQLEAQHSHLLHEMDGVKEGASEREIALQSKVNSLTSELLELHEFSKTRKQYQLKIATLEERITQMEESHKREITDAELSKVQEKERLKKEMLVKIKETKKNLLKLTEDQLDTTTKRTMLENEQMATELFYQSREIEKLLSRLEFLEKANKVLRREVDLVNSEKLGHAKKASLYLNLSQRLVTKSSSDDNNNNNKSNCSTAIDEVTSKVAQDSRQADSAPQTKRIHCLLLDVKRLERDLSESNSARSTAAKLVTQLAQVVNQVESPEAVEKVLRNVIGVLVPSAATTGTRAPSIAPQRSPTWSNNNKARSPRSRRIRKNDK